MQRVSPGGPFAYAHAEVNHVGGSGLSVEGLRVLSAGGLSLFRAYFGQHYVEPSNLFEALQKI